ncbi:MAG: DNA polymerase III subunit alpha [Patescibacteria group bacterium]|nr:DNA polymerase III subunit alpha [Patescibacteria group bacterium]
MSARFAPLHVHSHYSLLKALPKIPDLVARAKALGVESLALTDFDNLYGAVEFYKECKSVDIKPIIGLDLSLHGGTRVVLLAKNTEGYKNLIALVSETHKTNPQGEPAGLELLHARRGGLVALTREESHELRDIFGEDYHALPMQEIFYLNPEDERAWEVLRAIENRGPADEGSLTDEDDHSFISESGMEERFGPKAMEESLCIAKKCNLELTLGKFVFPDFPLPPDKSADDMLRELCEEGFITRTLAESIDVRERLEYELGIIKMKGYAAYFLVVEDLIRFAREHDIYYNIRGSVAGSIVTYLLRITKIDPLMYQIPFERFLNPERPSAPDIDMDFADDRRDEVIEYVRAKYGADKVAQIGTFGTMLARGVVRDVARALGYPYGLGDRVAKEIPFGSQGFPMTLERALAEHPELKKIYDSEREAKEIIDLGRKIEGCARHVGVHAAGVVISPSPLTDYTPLQLDPKGGKLITQYDMYSVGDDGGVGLTKFDFLGIRNLTMLQRSVALVERLRGHAIDIEAIPLDDKKTFDMLSRGQTEATFQLNGAGMTRFLKELRPTTIHDINAMVALYRPGPMQFIPQYIERKHNARLVRYLDPKMEPILKQTYGILVYQDDLLIMAHDLAGYSWGEVDKFRKAVGKKIPAEMAAQKEKFIKGCTEHSAWPKTKAEEVWNWIEPFAAYGFNKAHSASYGRVAYQTAYMKANYPVEYMAAVLSCEAGNIDTVATMVNECKRIGIPVLPPNVNESFGDFTVVAGDSHNINGAIRFGLYSIKNFGRAVADDIIAERKRGGAFTTLGDFLTRIKSQGLNKKALESLVGCGALDEFGERAAMLASIEMLLKFHRDSTEDHGHDSLFAGMAETAEPKLPAVASATLEERLGWEKELLGLYISGHPLDKFKDKLARTPMTIGQLRQKAIVGSTAIAAGMIEDIRTILTKGGDQMAFIKLADFNDSIEAVVFPKNFSEHKNILRRDSCVALKGRLSSRNGELSLVAEQLQAL